MPCILIDWLELSTLYTDNALSMCIYLNCNSGGKAQYHLLRLALCQCTFSVKHSGSRRIDVGMMFLASVRPPIDVGSSTSPCVYPIERPEVHV